MSDFEPSADGDEVHIERREAERVRVRTAVTMTSDSNLYVGFAADMSEGGLFVATHELLPIGEVVDLRIDLEDGDEPIEARAEVRWLRPVEDASENMMPGFGARFVDLDEASKARLEAFLSERDPVFFPA